MPKVKKNNAATKSLLRSDPYSSKPVNLKVGFKASQSKSTAASENSRHLLEEKMMTLKERSHMKNKKVVGNHKAVAAPVVITFKPSILPESTVFVETKKQNVVSYIDQLLANEEDPRPSRATIASVQSHASLSTNKFAALESFADEDEAMKYFVFKSPLLNFESQQQQQQQPNDVIDDSDI